MVKLYEQSKMEQPQQPPQEQEDQASDTKPRDVRLMELMLASMGINDFDEQVIPLLLEFAHRHISDLISESMVFAQHANIRNQDISADDLKLAIKAIQNSCPPQRDFLVNLAVDKNASPLPVISDRFGLRIPPKHLSLTNTRYNLTAKPSLPLSACSSPSAMSISPSVSPISQRHPALLDDDTDVDDMDVDTD